MPKERVEYIDVAKGIGILLVILGHSLVGDIFIKNVIYSFHMPFFFILSGYFLNFDRSIKTNIRKSCRMLLVPYFVVCSLQLLLVIFESQHVIPELQTIIFLGANFLNLHIGFQPAIWFIPVLFTSRMMCCLVFSKRLQYTNDVKYTVIVGLAFLSIIITNHLGITLPFGIQQTFVASFFLLCGHVANRNNILKKTELFLLPCLIFCCIAYSSKYLWMIMQINVYPYAFIHIICATVTSFSLLAIIKYVDYRKHKNIVVHTIFQLLKWCGRYSLLILLIHFFDDKNILLFISKTTIAENSALIFITRIIITLPLAYFLLKLRIVRQILNYN